METYFGDVALAQAVTYFISDIGARGSKALHGLLLLILIAIYSDVYPRGLAAWIHGDFRDVAKPDALVAEFALEQASDLVLQGFGYAVSMMACRTSLRHDFGSGKTFQDSRMRFLVSR